MVLFYCESLIILQMAKNIQSDFSFHDSIVQERTKRYQDVRYISLEPVIFNGFFRKFCSYNVSRETYKRLAVQTGVKKIYNFEQIKKSSFLRIGQPLKSVYTRGHKKLPCNLTHKRDKLQSLRKISSYVSIRNIHCRRQANIL